MGRKISGWWGRILLWGFLVWFCLWGMMPQAYAAQEEDTDVLHTADITVDQVDVRMPEIRLCIGGSDSGKVTPEETSVYIREEKLENVSLQPLSEATDESCMYLLLDVSRSLSETQFEALREMVLQLYESRAQGEQIVLVTFGDEIRVALEGEETQEEAEGRIAALSRDSQNTKLFEGIRKVTELAGQRQTEGFVRKTLVVVTDGVDEGFMEDATRQEALEALRRQGMAVYGMVAENGEREAVKSFGEFVRAAGGEMELWTEKDAGAVMERLMERIRSVLVLTARAGNNLVSYQTQTLTVVFDPWNLKKEISVYAGEWIPDQEPPRIVSVEQEENSFLTVTFSEPVAGLDVAANYQLKGEERLTVPVSAEKLGDTKVRLAFGEAFYQGEYVLSCVNMTDISMEKNPLGEEAAITLNGPERMDGPQESTRTGRLSLMAAAAAIAVIIWICILARRRKKEPEASARSQTLDIGGRSGRKRVILKRDDGVRIDFYPRNTLEKGRVITCTLHGSAIIGRSEICDVSFEDDLMSRQHFALEYEQGNLFITDLETVNGTFVNSVRITGRRRLEQDDVVSAGSMDLMLRWKEEKSCGVG